MEDPCLLSAGKIWKPEALLPTPEAAPAPFSWGSHRETNRTNLAAFSADKTVHDWISKLRASPGNRSYKLFHFFYLAALVWNISSTLKAGQAQAEWSEQSHDLNCEFYRSQQTPEITPGNYREHGLSLAAVLLVKHRCPPRLVWPQHSPSSSGVRGSDRAEGDGTWSLSYEQDSNRTWKSLLNTTWFLDVHLQMYDGQHPSLQACTINTTLVYRLHRWPSLSWPLEAGLNSPLALRGTNLLSSCSLKCQTLLHFPLINNTLQDTKWERQLPVSRPAYCTLPFHKTHSESNSALVLPLMAYDTCCLQLMPAIFQRWWHEVTHAVSFFPENDLFSSFTEEERKKRRKHCEKTLNSGKAKWGSEGASAVWGVHQLSIVLTQELLPTVGLHRVKDTDSAHWVPG